VTPTYATFPTSQLLTNAVVIRQGKIPCETNPDNGSLSRLSDPFHRLATLTVGSQKGNKRHVCEDCQRHYHEHQKCVGGVMWD